MNLSIKQAIQEWAAANIQTITPGTVLSIHIDDLLKAKIDKSQYLQYSIEAFLELIHEIAELGDPARPVLIIPLVSTSFTIQMKLPEDLDELQSELSDESPSLYMLARELAKKYDPVQEFKTPLNFSLFSGYQDQIDIQYRECRFHYAIQNNWEFSRFVYLEYFPEGRFK